LVLVESTAVIMYFFGCVLYISYKLSKWF
jgi:hypothetical protein